MLIQLYIYWSCSIAWSSFKVKVTGLLTPSPVISRESDAASAAAGDIRLAITARKKMPINVIRKRHTGGLFAVVITQPSFPLNRCYRFEIAQRRGDLFNKNYSLRLRCLRRYAPRHDTTDVFSSNDTSRGRFRDCPPLRGSH